jgi:hypothetical protein
LNQIKINETLNMLIDARIPTKILFVKQKIMNVNPGPNDYHLPRYSSVQELKERALKFVQ